jgi:hypothetical protein
MGAERNKIDRVPLKDSLQSGGVHARSY